MHGHYTKLVRFLNVACDFILLLLIFGLAGLLRTWLPFGKEFSMLDIARFYPLAVIYAVAMVSCYSITGSYTSLHCGGTFKEAIRIAFGNLIGLALVATLLYVFQLAQFSRLLLAYFYLLTTLAVLIKRKLVDHLATIHERSNNLITRVLVIGGGVTAKRYVNDVIHKNAQTMRYIGYLDDQETESMLGYLGTVEQIHQTLETHSVDLIVVAQETQTSSQLQTVIATADSYGIRVCVIPVYNDFVGGQTRIVVQAGLRLMEVQIMETCNIMGIDIVVTDMEKTLHMIEEKLQEWRGKYICVANVHTTVTEHSDRKYRAVQQGAVMALPDGGPLSAYSREHGYTEAQRVTGPDLMREILKISAQKGWSHYFYGSTQKTLDLLKQKIQERYPGTKIAGMYSPPFRELTPQEDAEIVKRINEAKPNFVWVGLGAPKQEIWMAAHENRVQALMIGVGAAFDYEAGNIKRAPLWMQQRNLEWLCRLMQDPRRLFKRYLTTNVRYLVWKWRQS